MKPNLLPIILIVFLICLVSVKIINRKHTLPKIKLPVEAHNTIGEIPIIEHFDDGDLGDKPGYTYGICVPIDEFKVFLGSLPKKEAEAIRWFDSRKGYAMIHPSSWDKYRKSGALVSNTFSYATYENYVEEAKRRIGRN